MEPGSFLGSGYILTIYAHNPGQFIPSVALQASYMGQQFYTYTCRKLLRNIT